MAAFARKRPYAEDSRHRRLGRRWSVRSIAGSRALPMTTIVGEHRQQQIPEHRWGSADQVLECADVQFSGPV